MTQSERLKKVLRELKGKGADGAGNYQKVAKKMGYNPNYISDIVNGRFAISEKFADRFQEAFSVNRNWLLYGTGDMNFQHRPAEYPSNHSKGNMASDISYPERCLRIEMENNKLMIEYSDIIQTLQARIKDLVEQQIEFMEEIARLKNHIKHLEETN